MKERGPRENLDEVAPTPEEVKWVFRGPVSGSRRHNGLGVRGDRIGTRGAPDRPVGELVLGLSEDCRTGLPGHGDRGEEEEGFEEL